MSIPALEVQYAYRRCEEITRREAANFYYGIRLLPRDKRLAMCAVYAFARRVDDIGDGEQLDVEGQRRALSAARALLGALQDDERASCDEDPVRVALGHAGRWYELPVDALQALIDGVELDVLGTRYATFEELVDYCRKVAGAVGRLCLAIFTEGSAGGEASALADDLGVAMQLTNILRDVREDHDRGRRYLPAEDVRRFGGAEDPFELEPAAAAELVRFEAERAARWFDRGLGLLERLDPRSASCVLAMTGIYRAILERISADPAQVLERRVSLATWEKAWVAARSLAVATPAGALA